MPIIRQQVKSDSIVYTDTWRSYNVLDVSKFKRSVPKLQLKQLNKWVKDELG